MRYGPWTKFVDGLEGIPPKEYGEDSLTDSDNNSSTGEFIDISLTTPENLPLHSYSRGLKVEKQLVPCITDFTLATL